VAEGLLAVVLFAVIAKAAKPFATADTHVFEILCTKVKTLSDMLPMPLRLPEHRLPDCTEPSFNARLYLIMGVFNVLEAASIHTYNLTSAGPLAIVACILVFIRCFCSSSMFSGGRSKAAAATHNRPKANSDAASNDSKGVAGAEGLRKRKGTAPTSTGDVASAPANASTLTVATSCETTDDGSSREEAALLFFAVQFILFFHVGLYCEQAPRRFWTTHDGYGRCLLWATPLSSARTSEQEQGLCCSNTFGGPLCACALDVEHVPLRRWDWTL
jgi:hypothetical protein